MLKHCLLGFALLLSAFFLDAATTGSGGNTNSLTVKTVNTPRDFPGISSAEEWRVRAKEIREQILVSAGLWPMPEKTPLQPHIFGKIERDGYTVEKVYIRTLPGFYLGGNLYRPLGRGKGPFPAVLNPHGHWKEGRLTDTDTGSIPARCISFARQGIVAFSFDMVGFNDTRFADSPTNLPFYDLHRQFGTNRTDQLWSISLMGLQTWSSIRALDFLTWLPDVDKKRLACTGASGGGTQTFMLGAIDDRLATQAPVVMVSHTMQGGCSCENMPGLRVEYSNMEIAAAAAPRPQILVAATGDWTKTTLTVEGPAIGRIYDLLKATDKLRYVRFDYGHNYNQTSREAVYEWFDKWLLNSSLSSCKEAPYQKEPDGDLRVFPHELPKDALTKEQLVSRLKKMHRKEWESLVPKNKRDLERFKKTMEPAWRHTLQISQGNTNALKIIPAAQSHGLVSAFLKIQDAAGLRELGVYLSRDGLETNTSPKLVVMVEPERTKPGPSPCEMELLARGMSVLVLTNSENSLGADPFLNFFTTYNRTRLQRIVFDLVTICSDPNSIDWRKHSPFRVVLVGKGKAGLAAVAATPAADAVIADCDQLDTSNDENLLVPDLFCPGIRNIGTFEGPAMLAAPHPLLLHNTGSNFATAAIKAAYKAEGATKKLRIEPSRFSDEELVNWIATLN